MTDWLDFYNIFVYQSIEIVYLTLNGQASPLTHSQRPDIDSCFCRFYK